MSLCVTLKDSKDIISALKKAIQLENSKTWNYDNGSKSFIPAGSTKNLDKKGVIKYILDDVFYDGKKIVTFYLDKKKDCKEKLTQNDYALFMGRVMSLLLGHAEKYIEDIEISVTPSDNDVIK